MQIHARAYGRLCTRCERILLDELSLRRPRQWGGWWLALELYCQLGLDSFLAGTCLPRARAPLGSNLPSPRHPRLLAPDSEWHLHREWFGRTALAEILEFYATLDQFLPLKESFSTICTTYCTSSSSTSKMSVAFGGMAPG